MAYTYHDWPVYTGADRVARLRQHVAEVGALLAAADLSDDGKSQSFATLQQYHASLLAQLSEHESSAGAMRAGGVSKITIGKPS